MNLVDIVIVALVLSALFRGHELGLVRQLGSTVGFIGGLAIGVALQPYTTNLVDTPMARSIVALLTVLGSAFVMLGIGEYVGFRLKNAFENRHFHRIDGWFGSVLGAATLLLAVWLGAAIINTMPLTQAQDEIRNSRILGQLNNTLPSTTTVLANLSHLIQPNGFPQVFTGNEPSLPANTNVPGIDSDLQRAIDRSKTSVVKMEGLGCGGVVEGTGFVIDTDLVVTNAHVIAGVRQPYVRDSNGQHTATPVWFDPELDFAIVRADNLAGGPLLLASDLAERRTRGAILGYPGGGPLTAGGASVIDHFTARGRDIYNQGFSDREVYSLAAKVIPGNSGGPVIAADGTVLGVIFAQSTSHQSVGYALSMPQLAGAINQAQAQNRQVSTGPCARQ